MGKPGVLHSMGCKESDTIERLHNILILALQVPYLRNPLSPRQTSVVIYPESKYHPLAKTLHQLSLIQAFKNSTTIPQTKLTNIPKYHFIPAMFFFFFFFTSCRQIKCQ